MRPEELIAADIRASLADNRVITEYNERPRDQRTGYVDWIETSANPGERVSRIEQMISELKTGGVYIGVPHPASRKEQHREPPEIDEPDLFG